jgi:uncharacterized membrane protein YeaQ/YmgE (transglycosylase-associated protein family)
MNEVLIILQHCLLAIFGTLAKFLSEKDNASIKFITCTRNCVGAAFAGLIIYFLSSYFDLDKNLGYALAGIGGWLGTQVLDVIARVISRSTGIQLEDNHDESNK